MTISKNNLFFCSTGYIYSLEDLLSDKPVVTKNRCRSAEKDLRK